MKSLSLKSLSPRHIVLQLSLFFRRAGLLHWIGMLLLTLGITYFTVGVTWERRLGEQMAQDIRDWIRERHDKASKEATDGPRQTAQRQQAFTDTLGKTERTEQYIKTIFAIAHRHAVALPEGEYRAANSPQGGFLTYEITLPVKGTYPALQAFCEDVLLELPFAALDAIQFRREAVATDGVEAKVRFTLYLLPTTQGPGLAATEIEPAKPLSLATPVSHGVIDAAGLSSVAILPGEIKR
ncbi:hypothetical protein [Collimonas silvisoli]|uniref:hypothetical protein n=1 Tax=Collimonas silvisoli TaxID=2825884 RepID=UPI001B8CC1DE|nr:hypothetical protein [Collimonas silvisoli]